MLKAAFNISDSSHPVQVGSFSLVHNHTDSVVVKDNWLYIPSSRGLDVVDVSNPSAPVRIGF